MFLVEMSTSDLSALPSRAWSCGTLVEGIQAAATMAGVSLEPGKTLDQQQARPWDSSAWSCANAHTHRF